MMTRPSIPCINPARFLLIQEFIVAQVVGGRWWRRKDANSLRRTITNTPTNKARFGGE
jgi:hypothetical protein